MRYLAVMLILLASAGCSALPGQSLPQKIILQPDLGEELGASKLEETRTVLAERLAALKVSGQVEAGPGNALTVSVPADADGAALSKALAARGMLEFIDPQGEYLLEDSLVCTSLTGSPSDPLTCAKTYTTIVDLSHLNQAEVSLTTDAADNPAVAFGFNEPGAAALEQFTASHRDKPMAIVLDKRVISVPVINGTLPGRGIITFGTGSGREQEAQAQNLLIQLTSGMLPVGLKVVEIKIEP